MKFDDVYYWIRVLFPYVFGVFIGLEIAVFICIFSGLSVQENKEIILPPVFNSTAGTIETANQTVLVMTDYGLNVFTPLIEVVIAVAILLILMFVVGFFYRTKDGI